MRRVRPRTRWPLALWLVALPLFAHPAGLDAQFVTDPVKNDTLLLRNGDLLTGEFRQLTRGLVTFKTDAMGTVSVKWPRVLQVSTRKEFEINMDNGSRYFGGLGPSERLGWVSIQAESGTIEVPISRIVDMVRLKGSFFRRMDGSVDFGADYTQQNNKVDLTLAANFRYVHRRNRASLGLSGSLTRQDSVSDISRGNASLGFTREFERSRWIWASILSAEQNSQLSLDLRVTLGTGPGRFWVQTNGIQFSSWLQLAATQEAFEGLESRNTLPLSVVTDFQVFNWAGLSTDLNSRLTVQQVLSDPGRWRFVLDMDLRKEIVNNLFLSVGLNEQYDTRPPTEGTNKNDFYVRTSLGWTFF